MKAFKGRFNPPQFKVGIVVSRFNELVTKSLLEGALEGFEKFGISESHITVVWVPGAFEIPLIAKQLATKGQFDAIICLGCVIRGATSHFDSVANQVSSGIAKVSLETNLPIIFQVLMTDTIEQALERAGTKSGNKGFEAALSALEMVDLLHQINCENNTFFKSSKMNSGNVELYPNNFKG